MTPPDTRPDVAAIVAEKLAELEQAVLTCDAESADYCGGAFNAVANLQSRLLSALSAAPVPAPTEALSDAEWDIVEEGISEMIGKAHSDAESWAGRRRESQFRREVEQCESVAAKLKRLRLSQAGPRPASGECSDRGKLEDCPICRERSRP